MDSLKSFREDLIALIAKETRIHKDEARKILATVLSSIVQLLRDKKSLRLINFGAFSVREIAEKKGRNPRTGEIIQIAAHKKISFKPGQAFREAINPVPVKAFLKKEKAKKTSRKKSS
jgi:DNA-binding protein HU-beta